MRLVRKSVCNVDRFQRAPFFKLLPLKNKFGLENTTRNWSGDFFVGLLYHAVRSFSSDVKFKKFPKTGPSQWRFFQFGRQINSVQFSCRPGVIRLAQSTDRLKTSIMPLIWRILSQNSWTVSRLTSWWTTACDSQILSLFSQWIPKFSVQDREEHDHYLQCKFPPSASLSSKSAD